VSGMEWSSVQNGKTSSSSSHSLSSLTSDAMGAAAKDAEQGGGRNGARRMNGLVRSASMALSPLWPSAASSAARRKLSSPASFSPSSSSASLQQPTWRYWGEERLPGAIYTVYLKKVRYHSPSKSVRNVSLNKLPILVG